MKYEDLFFISYGVLVCGLLYCAYHFRNYEVTIATIRVR